MSIVDFLNKKNDAIIGNGVSIECIDDAEKELNLSFADDYKEYLLNYGLLMLDGHEFTGLGGNDRVDVVKVTSYMKGIYKEIPVDWYVIEDLGIDGIVIWQNEKGEIFQSIPNGEIVKIYDDLLSYLKD